MTRLYAEVGVEFLVAVQTTIGETVAVQVTEPDQTPGPLLQLNDSDADGVYRGTFTPTAVGDYQLTIEAPGTPEDGLAAILTVSTTATFLDVARATGFNPDSLHLLNSFALPPSGANPLRDWRNILAGTLSIFLGEPHLGRFTVHAWPVPVLELPSGVIEPGGSGSYLDGGTTNEPTSFCHPDVVSWRVWLFAGIPGDEAAYDELDRLIARVSLAVDAVASHPSSGGAKPSRSSVSPPTVIEYGGHPYLAAWFDVSIPMRPTT